MYTMTLLNKDLKKAVEMEIKKLDQLLGQVMYIHNDLYLTHLGQVVCTMTLLNKDLKKAGEIEIKKVDQLLGQVMYTMTFI
jgi:hypothetical protein